MSDNYLKATPPGSPGPSGLPSLSKTTGNNKQRPASFTSDGNEFMADFIGFFCCENVVHHSYDSSVKPTKSHTHLLEKEFALDMHQQLNPRYIVSSLRFESQLCSATNRFLELSGNKMSNALRGIVRLSNLEEVSFIRSALSTLKGKFADVMNSSTISQFPSILTDQRKWRFRCAAEIQSLSRLSDKSTYRKDTEINMFNKDDHFSLLNWYHTSNCLERREFLCALIAQLDLATSRLLSDIIVDGQHRDFLQDLPEPVVKKIIGYLNAVARGRLSVVNHAYYQLIDAMKSPADGTAVTRLIELDNPMPNVPSFQKAFTELQSRENFRCGKYCRVTELEGHNGRVLCVTMWRNYIASGGSDKTVRVWTVSNSKKICTLNGHQAGVWCLQFFAKSMLLSGSFDSTIRLWSVKRARCLRELKGHSSAVWSLKVEGNFLVSGSQDKMAIIWDSVRGEPLYYLTAHKEAVFAVDLCCADRVAVTGSADRTVKIWSLDDGQMLKSVNVGLHMSVTAIAYSRGYIAAASSTAVKIFHIVPVKTANKNGNEEQQPAGYRNINVNNHWVDFEEEHHKRIESLGFRISNTNSNQLDGILITSGKDGFVKYWDLSQKSSLQTFKPLNGGVVNSVYFDAYRVAVAGENSKIRIYDFSLSAAQLRGAGFATGPKQPKAELKKGDGQTVTFVSDNATE